MKKEKPVVVLDSNFIDQISHFSSGFPNRSKLGHHPDCNGQINVKYIHQCIRLIVKRKLSPEPPKNSLFEKTRLVMDSYVKNKWINELEKSENPFIIAKDCGYLDHSIGVYCIVDAIVRINTEKFAFGFHYLGSKEFDSVVKNGPFKKDVIAMVATLFLSDLYGGMIVYEHKDSKTFLINRNERIYNAVLNKCKKINEFVIKKEIPARCISFKNKKCNLECS